MDPSCRLTEWPIGPSCQVEVDCAEIASLAQQVWFALFAGCLRVKFVLGYAELCPKGPASRSRYSKDQPQNSWQTVGVRRVSSLCRMLHGIDRASVFVSAQLPQATLQLESRRLLKLGGPGRQAARPPPHTPQPHPHPQPGRHPTPLYPTIPHYTPLHRRFPQKRPLFGAGQAPGGYGFNPVSSNLAPA